MNQSDRRRNRGNVKPLIALSLAVISTLYFINGPTVESPDAVSSADRDAVARALTRDFRGTSRIEHLIVTAPRISLPTLTLTTPTVDVAVVAIPPRIERDPS